MKFNKTILENGLRIITVPQPNTVAFTALVLVETGSKYENKTNSGVAHFLEHMCFKGTQNRPEPNQVTLELENLGAQNNAFTSQEYTGYYAKVASTKAPKALELVADLYLNPLLKQEDIDIEKGVIIEEINMYEDMPQRKAAEYFMSLLYGDQPAGWDIGGDKQVIMNMKREQFVDFRKAHYLPESTVLVLAGNFDEAALLSQAKELFAAMPSGEKSGKPAVTESQSKPEVILKHKASDQAHVVIGYRSFDMFDKRRIAAQVLSHVLGGGMGSRLFDLLRTKMGACYYVYADTDMYTDHGYIAAGAGVQLAKLSDAIVGIRKEFEKLREELVGDEELARVKNHLTGTLLLSLEGSDEIGNSYGIQELLRGEIVTLDILVEKIMAVSAEEMRDIAKEFFVPEKLNLSIVGPFEDKAEFEKLLK